MPTNAEAAELLRTIADLLDLTGEKFKPEAYRRAARSVETLTEPLGHYAQRGELRTIPGVGEAIAQKLAEYLASGRISYLDRLQTEVPAGVIELMRRPGLGPKTARRLWTEFSIESPGGLRTAIDEGRLAAAKGFGERKLAQFREAAGAPAAGARIRITEAYPIAQRLLEHLQTSLTSAERAEVAGSLRRMRETIGDVDLLVGSRRPTAIFDAAAKGSEVAEVVLRGETKMTLRLRSGLQVDVRVVEPDAFGAALQYFTGSKEHNIRLRSIARDLDLKLNEYGVYRGEERIAGRTEFDVYDALGLSWIPPEMREDHGEVDLATTDAVPALIEARDLHGDLHWHLAPSATPDDVDRALAEARRRRYDYVGVVVEGVDEARRPFSLSPEIRTRLGGRGTRRRPGEASVLWVAEREIGPGAAADDAGIDVLLVRPSSSSGPPAEAHLPSAACGLVHLDPARESSDALARSRAWLQYAADHGLSMEVGSEPGQLDPSAAHALLGLGGTLLVPTGVDRPATDPVGSIALGFARRAWATPAQVRNATKPDALAEFGRRAQEATMRSRARRARPATSGGTSMT